VMTVLSAWGLRRKRPDLPRAFRIPAGRTRTRLRHSLADRHDHRRPLTSATNCPAMGPWALALALLRTVIVKLFAKRAAQPNTKSS